MFQQNDHVRSDKFGIGHVLVCDGETVIVQFEHGIERCKLDDLVEVDSPRKSLRKEMWDVPLEVVTRLQAESIRSVNDTWGVLSKSRIALLPHQLWVCRRVLESWPTRWLVADDVGLGKTIEAGLILWPLLSRENVNRLLIICPASLVNQWQARLRDMFDIRVALYVSEADTSKSDFWHTHPQVVASLQTLRKDSNERHQRMLECPPWDLILVDEAHHLNADEQGGPTLGYRFLEKIVEANQVKSMVFFTGTPHRGKNYGFLSLVKLLRPDLFDPRKPLHEQLPMLRQVMIRNNKQNVTDLKGNRLFFPPKVTSDTYSYSHEEDRFYDMLTEFIATGKAYASTLSSNDQRTAILVLIAMQKLASSSVAAIRRALRNRHNRIQSTREQLAKLQAQRDLLSSYEELESNNDLDELNRLDEQLAETAANLSLMEDEEPRLAELIEAADAVGSETKIDKILSLLEESFPDRSVLFFTEYKATQSLLMSALIREYGDGCAAFINGDCVAEGVIQADGTSKAMKEGRESAASRFNAGKVRFLVSTEAAGEGIDLQNKCYTLVHVDLPWNPMRLHQRVGRLNRYGQTKQVEVMTLRNPSTVESRIWEKLNEKIDSIMQSMENVMDEPEDLLELVLGMSSPSMFREVFAGASDVPAGSLSKWFDEKTAKFGGQDVIDTVRNLIGHCSHFDFQAMSEKIPKLDLPALRQFFLAMIKLNNRNYEESDEGLSFKTPDCWLTSPAIRTTYRNVVFDRAAGKSIPSERILGVGHAIVDQAVRQARESTASVTSIAKSVLPNPVFVYRVVDKVTSKSSNIRAFVAGVEFLESGVELHRDWELLLKLNELLVKRTLRRDEAMSRPPGTESLDNQVKQGMDLVETHMADFELPFEVPEVHFLGVLWPGGETVKKSEPTLEIGNNE
ncbi:DEAD/DEAH box helicase [Gimesia maris]|uniref:DEAD/DEAH box helicase n=1 Tax=Gimesia maris TaxID=122 RepID=UPI00241C7513|nr:DEAD/DEAH box helicase [Gimesia maris]|tara:strand:+ start:18369 stop:21095 length:2727 start_codon:yes stop_codon:yes gene_type:complete